MITKISSDRRGLLIAISQLEYSQTSSGEFEKKIDKARLFAKQNNANYFVCGGACGIYEDDDIIIETAECAPFIRSQRLQFLASLSKRSTLSNKPLVYVNTIGVKDCGKTIRVIGGGSAVFLPDGNYIELGNRFAEYTKLVDLKDISDAKPLPVRESFDETCEAVIFGLRAFLTRLDIKRVVIGASGGIDSAVTSALYTHILGPENVFLIAMPGPFTSRTTRNLAAALAANLQTRYAEIPIQESVDLTARQFSELKSAGPGGGFEGAWELSPFALENVQARDRGSRILAAAAAVFGGVVSCNANKAEITVGYGTQYGDIIGWLAVLGDLWKGDVYAFGRYLNDKVFMKEAIPEGIFNIKPSAELSENHAIDKGLGDPLNYPYHDKLFRSWVEDNASPSAQMNEYLDGSLAETIGYNGKVEELFPNKDSFNDDIKRWWNLYRGLSVAKRLQAPPVLAVSKRAFGEFPEIQGMRD